MYYGSIARYASDDRTGRRTVAPDRRAFGLDHRAFGLDRRTFAPSTRRTVRRCLLRFIERVRVVAYQELLGVEVFGPVWRPLVVTG